MWRLTAERVLGIGSSREQVVHSGLDSPRTSGAKVGSVLCTKWHVPGRQDIPAATDSRITGIAVPALRGDSLTPFDIGERFKWAESRQTTREEDWAYSLLGIFDVFISPIYGEGKENAVHWLKKEIFEKLRYLGKPSQQHGMSPGIKTLPLLTLI